MEILDLRWDIIWNYRDYFIRGIWVTLILTLCGFFGGFVLGVLLGLGKNSKRKWLYWPVNYISIYSAEPPPCPNLHYPLGVDSDAFWTFARVHGFRYYSPHIELRRLYGRNHPGGDSIHWQRSNGSGKVPRFKSFSSNAESDSAPSLPTYDPPLGNEFITLLKDSSLVTVIAANDILYAAKVVSGAYFRFWEPYLAAALLYLILTFIVSKIVTFIERRFSIEYNPRKIKNEGRVEAWLKLRISIKVLEICTY